MKAATIGGVAADQPRSAQNIPGTGEAVHENSSRNARLRLALGGGLLVLTALVYARSIGNDFITDDGALIVSNPAIKRWSFLWESLFRSSWWFLESADYRSPYYRPLQDIWWGVSFHLFGLVPAPWHAAMIALHLVNVLLVFRIAGRLAASNPVALLAAALFAVLPIHADAVVWASAIPHPLAACLELTAFSLFIGRANGRWRMPLAWLSYGCALFTHESAVMLPALVGAYVVLVECPALESESGQPGATSWRARRGLVAAAPFILEVLLYLGARRQVLGFINRSSPNNHATIAMVLMTIPLAVSTYLKVSLVPWLASPFHRVPFVSSVESPGFYLPAIALAVLISGFLLLLRGDSRRRFHLFCVLWMGIEIAPVMNLTAFSPTGLVQDRYFYLASVGWCLLLADWTGIISRRLSRPDRAWAAAAGAIGVYALSLFHVQQFWHDNRSNYGQAIAEWPDSPDFHYGFGVWLEHAGDLNGAARELRAAVQVDPQSPALYDLGVVDSRLGHLKQAAAEEEEGLKRLSAPPADAYVGLAQVYDLSGDRTRSEAALKQAESMPNGAHVAALARAQSKYNHGDLAGAEAILRNLTAADPYDPRGWTVLGMTAIRQKSYGPALDYFRQAMALAPRDPFARVMAGLALHKLGRDQEALEQCRGALALAPDDPNARALIARIAREAPSNPPAIAP